MPRKSSLGGQNIYALKGAYLKSGIQDQGFLVGPKTQYHGPISEVGPRNGAHGYKR